MTYAEQLELLGRINQLEAAGQHREAIALCEGVLDGKEIPEFNLALARNHYALATQGNEIHAWPAMLAALDGIAKRTEQQPDVVHAIGICRWVLELFADPHRLDARGYYFRNAEQLAGNRWWEDPSKPPLPNTTTPPNLDEIEQLINSGQQVLGANALLAAAPSVVRFGRDAAGVSREARYLLASISSSLTPEKIAGFLAADDFPPPGDHGGQQYDRYLLSAATIHRAQVRARANGVPGILISSLPKSASEFLSSTLAETLQAPIMRVTVGDPVVGTALGKWVREIVRGGAVTHDHFAGTEVNVAALREGGLAEIWVLIRDPRAVYWSSLKMQGEYYSVQAKMDPVKVVGSVKLLGDWIGTWVRARDAGYPVRFVTFRELTEKPATVMGRILQASGAGRFVPKLHEVLQQRAEQDRVSSNFRTGNDEAWRSAVPGELHEAVWEVIDPRAKELLELKP